MFDRLRSDLAKRLGVLIDRFEDIERRASKQASDESLSSRLGLGGSSGIFDEIELKAREQTGLCADAIEALLIRRAFPVMFKSGVKRAEGFAEQCAAILIQAECGAAAGREAAREKLGLKLHSQTSVINNVSASLEQTSPFDQRKIDALRMATHDSRLPEDVRDKMEQTLSMAEAIQRHSQSNPPTENHKT
jgi:hypothetical protein